MPASGRACNPREGTSTGAHATSRPSEYLEDSSQANPRVLTIIRSYITGLNGKFRGHTLVWHSQLASWVNSITGSANVDAVMKAHVSVRAGSASVADTDERV